MQNLLQHIVRKPLVFTARFITIGALMTGCSSSITDDSVETIRSQEMAQWVAASSPKQLILDVREPSDYAAGHIPGAHNYLLQNVRYDEEHPVLSTYSVIVVYGKGAGSARAIAMSKRLLSTGSKKVFLLEGGFAGWRSQGGAVEQGE